MSSWRDGPVGSSRPCTGTGRGPSTGWSALRAVRQGCSPTGACSMAAAEQWEPDDGTTVRRGKRRIEYLPQAGEVGRDASGPSILPDGENLRGQEPDREAGGG